MFLKLVPTAYRKELAMKFQMGMKDYATLSSQVMTFAQQAKFDAGGVKDMEVDSLAVLENWMSEAPEEEVIDWLRHQREEEPSIVLLLLGCADDDDGTTGNP